MPGNPPQGEAKMREAGFREHGGESGNDLLEDGQVRGAGGEEQSPAERSSER